LRTLPLERESMQKKKGFLPKLKGLANSERMKALADAVNKATRTKEEKLMESDILTPEDIKYLSEKGLLEIDEDSEEIRLTAKGIKFLQDKRVRERPEEYTIREGEEPRVKLTDKAKEWEHRDDETW
jgi:hypothetical protein